MSCKKHREQIILDFYGELAGPEQRELERHLQDCSSCAQDRDYTRNVFNLIDRAESADIPEAGWDRCWGRISSGIERPDPARKSRWTWGPRWVPAAAAVLLVFALGIFLGRFWPGSQPAPDQASVQGPDFAPLNLQNHFDNLKPILAEYANRAVGDPESQDVLIDRRFIQSLLVQNFMLMRMAAQNNPEAASLLEDIDLVLREISNLDPDDPESSAMIRSLIDQRDILFKINVKHTL